MMKQIKKLLFLLLIIIIQLSFVPIIKNIGIKLNLFVVMICYLAIRCDRYTASIYAIIFGILSDILFSVSFGTYTLVYFLLTIFLTLAKEYFNTNNLLAAIVFTAGGTMIYNLIFGILLYFLSYKVNLLLLFKRVISIEILFNVIAGIILYYIEPMIGIKNYLFSNLRMDKTDEETKDSSTQKI